MPELPEVETVRRTLAPAIGATIAGAWSRGLGLHMGRKPPLAALKKLVGATLTAARRHGKYLLLDTDRGKTLLVHLGMTGRLRVVPASAERERHTHVVLGLGARELRYADARRFGQIDVLDTAREREHAGLAALGPDALVHGVDPAHLLARAKSKKTPLKAFVLDQRVLAGVGNIYASEALWRAKLRPSLRAHRLTATTAKALAAAITEVLTRSLDNHGTTPARLRRRRRRGGQQRRLPLGVRPRRAAVPALQSEDPPNGSPRSRDVLLSNVSGRVMTLC